MCLVAFGQRVGTGVPDEAVFGNDRLNVFMGEAFVEGNLNRRDRSRVWDVATHVAANHSSEIATGPAWAVQCDATR